MPFYTQSASPLRITTPLGKDAVLLLGFRGTEAVSELFSFELDLIAPDDSPVDFSAILGQPALVEIDLPEGRPTRYFHGIVSRFSQGHLDQRFHHYRAEVVPLLWLLTRRMQSRIFQHVTAVEILSKVFQGIPLKWNVMGRLAQRDFCTQYAESDYDFARRLMEEEGIYYYFEHTGEGHTLVLSDTPQGHRAVPAEIGFRYRPVPQGLEPNDFAIQAWEKSQEIRTGTFTLWDHNFELPHEHLDAEKAIPPSVTVGTVSHKLVVGPMAQLENYSYPGGYADWFDGIDRGGGEQAADLQHVYEQNRRLVAMRAQEEAAAAVRIVGRSNCANLTSGHKFTLQEHYDADGDYVLLRVKHEVTTTGNYASGDTIGLRYSNEFRALPAGLAYRPERTTPRPQVQGTQTAVVVGPAGEEIFTDKYGRVKVQFHWDREGKRDADSSCWIRVATIWAGKGWGVIHIPRIGHEVVVDFLEGNPDRPIVIGSVYNADHMPPGQLPKEAMISGLTSRSTPKAGPDNFNGMRADDTKTKEHLRIQAEYDQTSLVKHDEDHTVKNNRTVLVDVDHKETVKNNQTIEIGVDQKEKIGSNQSLEVGANQTIQIGGDRKFTLAGNDATKVGGNLKASVDGTSEITVNCAAKHSFQASLTDAITGDRKTTVGGAEKLTVSGSQTIEATGAIKISSAASIELSVGGSTIKIGPAGIEISAPKIDIQGSGPVSVMGAVVKINS